MFLFRVHVSYPCVAVGDMHARIICNFILLFVAFHSFSLSINVLHAIATICLISFVPSPATPAAFIRPPLFQPCAPILTSRRRCALRAGIFDPLGPF